MISRFKSRLLLASLSVSILFVQSWWCFLGVRPSHEWAVNTGNHGYPTITSDRFYDKLREQYKKFMLTREFMGADQYSIIIVADATATSKYEGHIAAVRCYAMRHSYLFAVLDPKRYSECSHIGNFFFRKHCLVLLYLIYAHSVKWLLVLDGDNVLVNASKKIEEYIPLNSNVHVIHYERFYNGEIMAGNYLIKNHQWSYNYLLNWINLERYLPPVFYHNNDNGAIHIHLLIMLNVSKEGAKKCIKLWQRSTNEVIYDEFIGCFKCALAGRRKFPHLWIFRRGHGFARDYREPENAVFPTDFLIHSFKNDTKYYYSRKVKMNECRNEFNWNPPLHPYLMVRNLSLARELITFHDYTAALKHPASVGYPDVGDCWPQCDPEINDLTLEQQLRIICK